MDTLRIVAQESVPPLTGCCRCLEVNRRWDRIAGKAYCPNCQELMIQGEGDPLVLRTEPNRCAVCDRPGTVCYLTYPLQAEAPLEVDLCPEHLRCLLGRCLEPAAFQQLRRQLEALNLHAADVFLLHGAFYDDQGRASLPALERE